MQDSASVGQARETITVLSGEIRHRIRIGGHEFFGVICNEDEEFVLYVIHKEISFFFLVFVHPYYEALHVFAGVPRQTFASACADLDLLAHNKPSTRKKNLLGFITSEIADHFVRIWSVFDAWEKKLTHTITEDDNRLTLGVDQPLLRFLLKLASQAEVPVTNKQLVQALSEVGLCLPVPFLIARYRSGSKGLKKAIIVSLKRCRTTAAELFLVSILKEESECALWPEVFNTLLGSSNEQLMTFLLRFAGTAVGQIRFQALRVLFSSGLPLVRKTLMDGLVDADPQMRAVAARCCMKLLDRGLVSSVIRLAQGDPDCRVRIAARSSIRSLFRVSATDDPTPSAGRGSEK
jgi:hypothetical protein